MKAKVILLAFITLLVSCKSQEVATEKQTDYFGGYIDSFKYRIAYEMGVTKIAVTKLLNRLYKLKLAERMPNGKLKVN